MRHANNLENKIPSETYLKVQLVCMESQVHSFLKALLEYDKDQVPLTNQG